MHSHEFYEYIYVMRGECNQRFEFPYRSVLLKAGQSCLLCPGTVHAVERCGANDIILKLSIPVKLFGEIIMPIAPAAFLDENVIIFENHSIQTDWYIYMLIMENYLKRDFLDTAVKNYLSLLFIELVRKPLKEYPDILIKLSSYFEKNPSEVNLSEFAGLVGYSADYTGRLIKKSTGKSFVDNVLELRLERASKLLIETDYPVEIIAGMVGYANMSGFYKQFCRNYGMTLNEYRKKFL